MRDGGTCNLPRKSAFPRFMRELPGYHIGPAFTTVSQFLYLEPTADDNGRINNVLDKADMAINTASNSQESTLL